MKSRLVASSLVTASETLSEPVAQSHEAITRDKMNEGRSSERGRRGSRYMGRIFFLIWEAVAGIQQSLGPLTPLSGPSCLRDVI